MKTTLGIKNFRIFDEKGVEFKLEPITFLTGCNSSGKSSVVKAILFLQAFLKQIMEDHKTGKEIRLEDYKVNFNAYPLNSLGGFSKVVHRKSDNKSITIEYTTYSKMLSSDVNVSMTFDSPESDYLDNAYLANLSVSLDNQVFFSTSRNAKPLYDINGIKAIAKEYVIMEDILNRKEYLEERDGYDDMGKSSNELEEEYKKIVEEIKQYNQKRIDEVSATRRYGKKPTRIIKDIDWQLANESLFHIGFLDKCDGMSKSETIDYLGEVAEDLYYFNEKTGKWKGMYPEKKGALYRIIWLFKDSAHTTFKSFWLDYERRFLSSQEIESEDEGIKDFWSQKEGLTAKTNLEIPQPFNFNRIDGIFDNYVEVLSDIANKFSVYNGEIDISLDGKNQKEEYEEYSKILYGIYNKPEPLDFKYLYSVLTDIDFFYFDNATHKCDFDSPYNWQEVNEWQGISYGVDYYYLKNNYHIDDCGLYIHYMAEAINGFINRLILEVLTPEWIDNISYFSSNRIDAQRLYTLDKQDDFTKLIKRYFEARAQFDKQCGSNNGTSYLLDIGDANKYIVGTFVKDWCKKLGIGNNLELSLLPDGIGAQVKIFDDDFPEGNLLSYEGYGLTQLMSILLQIETEILSNRKGTIIIEEPEIHLHPRLQSMLTDMFYEAYKEYGIHFIIETHSEYMIRKSQALVKQMNYDSQEELEKNCPFRTYYIPENGAEPYSLVYRTDGVFENDFGEGFFDEAEKLAFQIL